MLQKIIYIIFILNTFTVYSHGIHISEYNETNVILTIYSQLSDIRAGQEKLTKELAKDSDIQFIRAELEKQKNCVVVKEADSESLRVDIQVLRTDIQSLRAELDNLKNEKDSAIQSLRTDNQVFKTDIQSLQAEIEQQKKYILDKEADNQILRAELERHEKLKRQESDKHHDCSEAKFSGIHDILVHKAACDVKTRGGGWTIILRRMDGSVNFTRNWAEYKKGFGNLDGEYFLGLEKIHAMTAERPQELLIILEDFEGDERFETYEEFAIGDESQQYELHTLGKASGTAGDSLEWHRGMKFSTFDKDNDDYPDENCALRNTGGWWYKYCQTSHLTGSYKDNRWQKGVTWYHFREHQYSLKRAIMMIRPKK